MVFPQRKFEACGSSVEVDLFRGKQGHTVEDHFAAVVTLRSQEEFPNPSLP